MTARHRLLCADVAEVLAGLEPGSVGLVHADPPWTYDVTGGRSAADAEYSGLDMLSIAAHLDAAYDAARPDAYMLVWCTWPLLGAWMAHHRRMRWEYLSGGMWTKTGAPGMGHHWRVDSEPLLLYRRGAPHPQHHRLSNAYDGPRGRHSEKPAEWLRDLVETFSAPDDLVLDLYAGLAPMMRACQATGRRYLGAEIDPDRHRTALGLPPIGGVQVEMWGVR